MRARASFPGKANGLYGFDPLPLGEASERLPLLLLTAWTLYDMADLQPTRISMLRKRGKGPGEFRWPDCCKICSMTLTTGNGVQAFMGFGRPQASHRRVSMVRPTDRIHAGAHCFDYSRFLAGGVLMTLTANTTPVLISLYRYTYSSRETIYPFYVTIYSGE